MGQTNLWQARSSPAAVVAGTEPYARRIDAVLVIQLPLIKLIDGHDDAREVHPVEDGA